MDAERYYLQFKSIVYGQFRASKIYSLLIEVELAFCSVLF